LSVYSLRNIDISSGSVIVASLGYNTVMKRINTTWINRLKWPVLGLIVLSVLLAVSMSMKHFDTRTSEMPADSVSGNAKVVSVPLPSGTPVPVVSPSGSTQPAATSAPATSKGSAKSVSTPFPVLTPYGQGAPFRITSIMLRDSYASQCNSNSVSLYIGSADVRTSSSVGGTFTWQIDDINSDPPYDSIPQTATIPANTFAKTLATPTPPGFLISLPDVSPGEAIRVHVTSPNDIYSNWIAAPSVISCP
jgi:hypothetical protein